MSTVNDVLADLHAFLEQRRIDWYVFGAQAVVVFGRPRQTLDVDVTIDIPVQDVTELPAGLEKAGFSARVDDLVAFIRRTQVAPVVHRSSGIPVDLIIAGPVLERESLQRKRLVEILGLSIPFISPEDLIATKILAGRAKDLDDVRGILEKQRRSLKEDRVRDVLTRLEHALDRSDLVEIFESQLSE